MRKNGKRLSLTGLLIGLLFLWNPLIGMFDLLPDLFGYLLILFSLRNLSATGYGFDEAFRKFKNLTLLEVGRLFLLFAVFLLNDVTEYANAVLIVIFCYSLFDLIFSLPAYRSLFYAFSLSADRIGSEAINREYGKKNRPAVTVAERGTFVFLLVRAILQLIPELSVLSLSSSDEHNKFRIFYEYIGAFRVIFAIPILIVGLIWLVRTFRFFRSVKKDTEYMRGLSDKLSENTLCDPGFFPMRKLSVCGVLVWLASVFFFDFRMDGIDLLPDSVGVILLFASLLLIGSVLPKQKKVCRVVLPIVSGVLSAFSLLVSVLDTKYYAKYTERSIFFSEDAYYAFLQLNILSYVEYAIILLSYVFLFLSMKTAYQSASDRGREPTEYERAESRENVRFFIRVPIAACLLTAGKVIYLSFFTVTDAITPVLLISSVIAGFIIGFTFSEFRSVLRKTYEMKISRKISG